MAIERINPATLADMSGYSHVVKDGDTVYVAGQLARNSDGETIGEGDFEAQAVQAFKNVQAALESVGSNMSSILKMNVFMTHREDIPAYRQIKTRFVTDDALPVSTLILCSGLADPVFRIEVEVIAKID
ncbi:MAG: RidA family protein [Chloroflexi bacterium]|nr:RidA family protein [Chloroflexota bacterium]